MIKALQKKFIRIAMLSLFLVILVLLSVINGFNFAKADEKADAVLAVLAENDGRFPMEEKPGRPKEEKRGKQDKITPETAFETRYFAVRADSSNAITQIDTSHIAAVTSAEAQEYAQAVLKKGRNKGYLDSYRYLKTDKEGETLLIFVDCTNQRGLSLSFLFNSSAVAAVSLLVVWLLVTLLSGRAIRPVAESMEKQKQFITDAGHEIKTPLAIISANSEVLEMTHGESEWTTSIQNQVKRLNGLVQNMLALSKMEEGSLKQDFAPVDFSAVVSTASEDFIPLAGQKGITILEEIAPGVTVKGEQNSLNYLLNILLDNAVKYADVPGQINLRLTKNGKNCVLEVSNTCREIPENLERLFDRFYRADSSRARESGGYGVGLAVAKAIVESHGGKIIALKEEENRILFRATL